MNLQRQNNNTHFEPPGTIREIRTLPGILWVFLKAFFIAPFRSNLRAQSKPVHPCIIRLKNYRIDPNLVDDYRRVCEYNEYHENLIPTAFLQTLFIGILGKYITSSYFPFNPLGLIQIYQSFEQMEPVTTDDSLDLSCRLSTIRKTDKGIETDFELQVEIDNEIIWQGVSRYLSRTGKKAGTKKKPVDDIQMPKMATIHIPAGTGRKYANVSRDYNPHHLYPVLAKLFGFKTAIAHGMYSLSRVLAHMGEHFDLSNGYRVETWFKLPVFMPAITRLCWEIPIDETDQAPVINFELRDDKKGLPHLKGSIFPK